jgi:hypothetical protein
LISEGQRNVILDNYVVVKHLPAVVVTLGALMIGIGVLSFIAANWRMMPGWLKIALIVSSYVASVAGAYYFERSSRKTASEILLFFSGFLILGGIALMSQIFHIAGDLTDLWVTWLIVFAPTLLLVRSIPIYVLYESIALIYINSIYYQYNDLFSFSRDRLHPFNILEIFTPYQPTILMIFMVALAWWIWRESRKNELAAGGSKIKAILLGGSARAVFWSNFLILNWFTWICVTNSRGNGPLPFIFAIIFIGIIIEAMAYKLNTGDLDLQGLLCVTLSGMSLTFGSIWEIGRYRYDQGIGRPLISSLILAVYLFYRIIYRSRFGGLSVFLLCVLLARWYFDMFYSFMSKSLFFILGGVLMLAIAFAYRRWNKWNKSASKSAGSSVDSDSAHYGGEGR